MKTPEYKGPASLSRDNYTENCKLITLPEGYRFLKIGEKSRKEDFHTPFGRGQWKNNEEVGCYGDVIKGHMWPQIRAVDYIRGPKGRFVSTKPAPPAPKAVLNKEMVDWIARVASNERDYAVTCVKRYKEFLAGDETGCMNFPWYDTPNSGRWNDIHEGSVKPTEADKEYVRAILEAMEKGLEDKTPKVAPASKPAEPKVKVELLRAHIKVLERELADLKAWKARVLAATI